MESQRLQAGDTLSSAHFVCPGCKAKFEAPPDRVEPAPDQPHHPHRYFATCRACGAEAAQAPWERALLKAWTCATGPRTPEGLARTAANLDGHPTPAETLGTRFNAMKHGLYSRVATHFPAKPGQYPHCTTCEYAADEGCVQYRACLKRTELYLKHQIAFENQDPRLLTDLRADTQAAIQALINDMILAITQSGVEIKHPVYGFDKDGGFNIGTYRDPNTGENKTIIEHHAHPLLKLLAEFIGRNTMSLADMGMTPKVKDDSETMRGFLAGQAPQQQSVLEFQKQNQKALGDLAAMIERSREQTRKDPILAECREVESG